MESNYNRSKSVILKSAISKSRGPTHRQTDKEVIQYSSKEGIIFPPKDIFYLNVHQYQQATIQGNFNGTTPKLKNLVIRLLFNPSKPGGNYVYQLS
jgi:hypothetical protein